MHWKSKHLIFKKNKKIAYLKMLKEYLESIR